MGPTLVIHSQHVYFNHSLRQKFSNKGDVSNFFFVFLNMGGRWTQVHPEKNLCVFKKEKCGF